MSYKDALLQSIERYGGKDIIIPYWDVAWAFPSIEPHPDSFEYKLIDEKSFLKWAEANNFTVSKVPAKAPEGAKHSPPIRFQKKSK